MYAKRLRVKGPRGKPPFGRSMDKPAGNSIGVDVFPLIGIYYILLNMIGIIYKYTSPSNKIYIGQTTNERRRRSEFLDINKSYAGTAIHYARKKYGPTAFDYEILTCVESSTKQDLKTELDFWERYYITFYKDLGYELYNLTDGGDVGTFGYHHCEESKLKISRGNLGKHHSEETKRKMSESQKGKHSGPRPQKWYKNRKCRKGVSNVWLRKSVKSIDPITLKETIYPSIKAAAETIGVNESSIRKALTGHCKTIKGLQWFKV